MPPGALGRMVIPAHGLPATMGTRLGGPQGRRFLNADHHFPLLVLVVHTADAPRIAQRQNLMKHFFRYHKAANLRFTACPFQPHLPTTRVEEAEFGIWPMTENVVVPGFTACNPASVD
jgi:hypothetical protein